jgi:integrase/recombinase XerD
VLSVRGKGAKDMVVPISKVLAEKLRTWCVEIQTGKVARSLGRKQIIGDSLSAIGIFQIVRKHGAMIGKQELDPHDLRRTYAQLGYEAGVPLTQLSKLLGHADIATTQRYLNLDLDLETTASDFIPLEG